MLAEASLRSQRKRKRETDDKLKGKRGHGRGQNEKDEETEARKDPVAPLLPSSQAATGRQAKNILSLKVLTAPVYPPPLLLLSLFPLSYVTPSSPAPSQHYKSPPSPSLHCFASSFLSPPFASCHR